MLATFTSHCKLRLSLCSFTALSPHFLPISVFPFPFRIVLLFSLSPDSHSVRGSQSLWRSAGGSRVCDGSSAGQGGGGGAAQPCAEPSTVQAPPVLCTLAAPTSHRFQNTHTYFHSAGSANTYPNAPSVLCLVKDCPVTTVQEG